MNVSDKHCEISYFLNDVELHFIFFISFSSDYQIDMSSTQQHRYGT